MKKQLLFKFYNRLLSDISSKVAGFTLTELLIALGIVGAIAAMTIPSLMTEINNKILATALKNSVAEIQTVITEQLVENKTQTLEKTDFSSADKLFSSKNFDMIKYCPAENSLIDCWQTKKADDEDEQYSGDVHYKLIDSKEASVAIPKSPTMVLKNGAIIRYMSGNFDFLNSILPDVYVAFDIDVNGKDGPNIIGRDVFSLLITKDGRIGGCSGDVDYTTAVSECKSKVGEGYYCTCAVIRDNWKIKY